MPRSIFDDDPLYRNVEDSTRRQDSGLSGDQDDWWEHPLVFLLAAVAAWVFLGGWRGVGLVVVVAIVVAALMWFRSTVAAIVTLTVGFLVLMLYIHIAWQFL